MRQRSLDRDVFSQPVWDSLTFVTPETTGQSRAVPKRLYLTAKTAAFVQSFTSELCCAYECLKSINFAHWQSCHEKVFERF